jgi:putative CocE/NonD family hydrolase
MLVCGSFSDHCLHSRGSLEAFRRVGSPQKWLWTHRGGKWSSFYSAEAFSDQLAFFDYFLKGANNGWASRPAVRLCTADGEAPGQERIEHLESFPPVDVKPTSYWLTAQGQLNQQAPEASATLSWPEAQSSISWTISFAQTVTFSGPMELMLNLKVDAEDLDLFVAVGKWRNGRRVGYEGSFGFDQDFITHGQLRLSQREIDPERSAPCAPVLRHQQHLPIKQGELLQVRIPLLSSSTRFHPGEMLKLELHRRWFFPRQPVSGQFPASYEQCNKPCTVNIQSGGQNSSALICPQRSC